MEPDVALQDKIIVQSDIYSSATGSFAKDMAIRQREILNPITWWERHGSSTPELSKIAVHLLSLCCSSSGCERNWSTFEFIHSKKRNRLEHQRLNNLVYIQYNRRLETRFQERKEKCRNYNPLVLEELDWSSEWMTGQPTEDLVHPNDDITWDMVDREIGASTTFQGHNRPRRLRNEELLDSEVEEALEVEMDVNDDENIEDDFGVSASNTTRESQSLEQTQDDDFLVDF